MPRVNVWIPDDLHDEVRAATINVSAVTQDALREALAAGRTSTWLATLADLPPIDRPDHLLDDAKDDAWGHG